MWLRVWLDQDLQTLFSPLFSQGDVAFVGQKIISPIERATRVSSKIIRNTVKDHLTCEVWYCAYFCKNCGASRLGLRLACRLAKVPSSHAHVPRQAGLGLPRGLLQRQPRLAQ